jgi:hypothetical protein
MWSNTLHGIRKHTDYSTMDLWIGFRSIPSLDNLRATLNNVEVTVSVLRLNFCLWGLCSLYLHV